MTSGLPVAALRTASQGGDGALPVPVQEASMHARVPDDAGWYGSSLYRIRPCCLLLPRRHRHPGLNCFRRSQPGLHTPLSTLRVTPRGATRMTRGRCGSLPLHRNGLSPSTSCRSPGAPRLNGWPIRSPTDASPTSSRTPAHGSGATWIATPSSQWTFTTYSLPVSRRTHSRCGLHTRAVTNFVTAIRGPQTFRHLHACPGCFRLERSPGGACTRWKSAALSRRTWFPVIPDLPCVRCPYFKSGHLSP